MFLYKCQSFNLDSLSEDNHQMDLGKRLALKKNDSDKVHGFVPNIYIFNKNRLYPENDKISCEGKKGQNVVQVFCLSIILSVNVQLN